MGSRRYETRRTAGLLAQRRKSQARYGDRAGVMADHSRLAGLLAANISRLSTTVSSFPARRDRALVCRAALATSLH